MVRNVLTLGICHKDLKLRIKNTSDFNFFVAGKMNSSNRVQFSAKLIVYGLYILSGRILATRL